MRKLLYFYGDFCMPCKQLSPIMNEVSQQIPVEKVNVDSNPTKAQAWRVRSVPTVILIENNTEIGRKVGAHPKSTYIDMYEK